MEAISKTFSQDESIDEALEATNFSIVEIDLSSSSSASNHQDRRHCSSSFSIYKMAISETSDEYQSITGTGGRETRYKLKQHQPFRRMKLSSGRCTANHNSLSFSSSDGIHERGTSTDSNDDDDVYSIPDVEMKKVFQVLPNKEIIPVWVQDADRGPDCELFASNSKSTSSSSAENRDRQRMTPVELSLLPQDGRGESIDGETAREEKRRTPETKSKTVEGFRVVSPTQHLSGNWCGVNFCANDKSGVLDDSAVDPPVTCANECDQEKNRDSELERAENGPAARPFFPLLESAPQINEEDGPSTSRHTENSSFRRSKRGDLDARSARLMSRMVDRAVHFQQSSRTIMSQVDDSQEESASLDDAPGEELSQALGGLFAEFWQNPRNFFEIYACLKAPQTHDSMGAYVTSTHTESTTGSEDEAGCIPENLSSVEPTTSDDSFRSDEQEQRGCHKPMVDILMGLTSKLNMHQDHLHESSQPSKCREVIDSGHSVGNHLRRTVMILSDDDLSEASDLFSDCDENRCFSRFVADSVNDTGTLSKPPLYAARYNHVATAPPCNEHHLNRIERHLPELMGSMRDSDMGYDSEPEPSVTFPHSRDGTADKDYDDDSLIDYAELERDLQMEEQNFYAASQYQYQSFSAPTHS